MPGGAGFPSGFPSRAGFPPPSRPRRDRFIVNYKLTLLGAAIGWVCGYAVVYSRMEELRESPFVYAQGIQMIPTAPDTIMFTVIGAVAGFLIGLLKYAMKKGETDP